MNQEKLVDSHIISGLEVAALNSNNYYELPDVFTQTVMPGTRDNIPKQEELSAWHHLNTVKLPVIDVGLLIGANASKLMEPWEVVNSNDDGPYAVRTLLGWVVNGLLRGDRQIVNSCPTIAVNQISLTSLEELLVKQYNHDFSERSVDEKPEMSREDLKFLEIMKSSANLTDGHYGLKLPFREENVSMPNNRHVAEQRALCLKRKFKSMSTFWAMS